MVVLSVGWLAGWNGNCFAEIFFICESVMGIPFLVEHEVGKNCVDSHVELLSL